MKAEAKRAREETSAMLEELMQQRDAKKAKIKAKITPKKGTLEWIEAHWTGLVRRATPADKHQDLWISEIVQRSRKKSSPRIKCTCLRRRSES